MELGGKRGAFNFGAPHPSWDGSRLEFWLGVCPSLVLSSWGENRPYSGGVTKPKSWLESFTTFRLAWLESRLPLKPTSLVEPEEKVGGKKNWPGGIRIAF